MAPCSASSGRSASGFARAPLFSQTQGGCGLHLITSGVLSRAGRRRAVGPASGYPESESVTRWEVGAVRRFQYLDP